MNNNQVFNPYLPLHEYIPDGEPHVFGDRIYVYGSHDRFDGGRFCLNDYVCYSADVKDLKHWKYEGVIYSRMQDPVNQLPDEEKIPLNENYGFKYNIDPYGIHAMWAPDVVQGKDGRYYLYYCLDYLPEIGVAVCDTPAGKYEYLGRVCHKDGIPLGSREGDLIQFDPGVFLDDDGICYLFSGNGPMNKGQGVMPNKASQVMALEDDMLTLKQEAKTLLPTLFEAIGTEYEEHPFFEASSIRKINGKYYLVYSSTNSHELCYAVSDRPDEGYRFGGTIVDIGDVYLNGREEKDSLNPRGNTHGGIECADGKWYVFYHRQTNRTNFSRQGCAEEICFLEDGSIPQVEVTSCGLNGGPLRSEGKYPASICCKLTGKDGVTMSLPEDSDERYPYVRQFFQDVDPDQVTGDEIDPVQGVLNLRDGAEVGYKYFGGKFEGRMSLALRGYGDVKVEIAAIDRKSGEEMICGTLTAAGTIAMEDNRTLWDCREFGGAPGEPFKEFTADVAVPYEEYALYFRFSGDGVYDLHYFVFEK